MKVLLLVVVPLAVVATLAGLAIGFGGPGEPAPMASINDPFKNLATALLYLLSIPLAFFSVWASIFIFVLIPTLYFMPGPTVERLARANHDGAG